MNICGYAHIKPNATTGRGSLPISEFAGEIVRVMEFGYDDCVLVVNSEATGLAMFDKEDVMRSFKCSISGQYICPPNLDPLAQGAYIISLLSRRGGYSPVLKNMVIAGSLAKGRFYDDFLWQNPQGKVEDMNWLANYGIRF